MKLFCLILALAVFGPANPLLSQDVSAVAKDDEATATVADGSSAESERRVLSRVVPFYPQLARNMNLKGNVRVEALVAQDGKVKSVSTRGGHPILIQAAENAVYKWKWVPTKHETREVIDVRFDPR
jgi:TonB family protein